VATHAPPPPVLRSSSAFSVSVAYFPRFRNDRRASVCNLYAQRLMDGSLADNCSALSTDVELAGSFQIEYSLPHCF
jgi:hypothetical protein